jgi:hypothetical protein
VAPNPSAGGPYTITEGQSLTLNASASSDAHSYPLSYSWDVNGDNRFGDALGVQPTLTWGQLNNLGITDGGTTYQVRVNVTNSIGLISTSESATVTVNPVAPTATISGPVAVTEGSTYALSLAAAYTGDPDGDKVIAWTISWGDGTTSTLSGSPTTATHTFAEEGPVAILAAAQDDDSSFAAASTVNVTVQDALLQALGQAVAATEGAAFNGVVATFTDPGSDGTAADYTATITWGDGHVSAGAVSANGQAGFAVSGTNSYAEQGPYSLQIAIQDRGGANATVPTAAVVADANVVTADRSMAAVEGAAFSGVVAAFRDPGGDGTSNDYTASIAWGDGHTSAGTFSPDGNGGFLVGGTNTYAEQGTNTITVTLTDQGGAAAIVTSTASVADAALQASSQAITATENAALNGVVAAFRDPGGDGTTADYSATITWGDGHTAAGTITGDGNGGFLVNGANTYAEEGTYPVSVTISDQGGAAAIVTNTATVADATLQATSQALTATENTAFSGVVAGFRDPGSDGTTGDYSATISWGDGNATAGTIATDGMGGFAVSGANTYAEEGSYTFTVVLHDHGGALATVTNTVSVADAGLVATGSNISATQGMLFSGTVAAFRDPGSDGTAGDYTATIVWGNGQTSAGTVALGGPGFLVSGSNLYTAEGSYSITVTLQDVGGASTSAAATAVVSDETLTVGPIVAAEGVTFNGTVASFVDAAPGDTPSNFQATITWGDGNSSTGVVTANGGGGFTIAGTNTYLQGGSYSITVTLQELDGSATMVTGAAQVTDPLLTASALGISSTEGVAFTGMVATFTDPNPNDPASTFMATISWGDGHTSSGTISGSGGAFSVSGSNTYAEDGTFAIGVQIFDVGGTTASAAGSATIVDAALVAGSSLTVKPTEGSTFAGLVATFTDSGSDGTSGDYTASISWGDGHTSMGSVTAAAAGVWNVSGMDTFAEEGSYAITVTLQDRGGAATSISATAVVGDAPFQANAQTVTPAEKSGFNGVIATFMDPGTDGSAADYSATIAWGDGHTSGGTVTPAGNGLFTISGSNTYADGGTYSFQVSITDVGGASATIGGTAQVADSPLSATAVGISSTERATFNGVVATFNDANPIEPTSSYTATITWGDGHTSAGTISATGGGNFTVSGSNTYAEEGTFPVSVQIVDAAGSAATISGNAAIADAPLVAGSSLTVTPTEGGALTAIVATFTDAGSDGTSTDYTATITWGDGHTSAGTVTAAGSGVWNVNGTNTFGEEGSYAITVTLQDRGGASTTIGATANVADAALSSSGVAVSATEGGVFTGAVATFADLGNDGTVADYSATITWGDGHTSAGIINAASGAFTVSGTNTYAEEGSYGVTVVLSDKGGASATTTSTATVSDAPLVLFTNGYLTGVEGGTVALNGNTFQFLDAGTDGTMADYTVTINWGDGQTTPGGVVALDPLYPQGGFAIAGSHVYKEEGVYSISILLQVRGGASATYPATPATIGDAIPTLLGNSINATEKAAFTGTLATFRDIGTDGTTADYTATINWGDGQNSSGTITSLGNLLFSVQGAHTYSEQGSYTATVSIKDHGGANASVSVTATVADAALGVTTNSIAATEGAGFSGQVATFTDPGSDGTIADYTATITWGDGQSSAGTISSNGMGGFNVKATHTYAEEGSYTLTVTIKDSGGAGAAPTSNAAVADAALKATAATIKPAHGTTFSGTVATFTDADPQGTVADYTATINWGDGTATTAGTIKANASKFQVNGTHKYVAKGNYTITITIKDGGGSSIQVISSAQVSNPVGSPAPVGWDLRGGGTASGNGPPVAMIRALEARGPTQAITAASWQLEANDLWQVSGTSKVGNLTLAPLANEAVLDRWFQDFEWDWIRSGLAQE